MILTDENFDRLKRARRWWTVSTTILLLGFLGLTAACGGRRVNVMRTPEQNLMAIGYSSDRSGSILRANDDAQLYCERQKKDVMYIKQDTLYQGQYDEDVTAAAKTAGRVAGALGSVKGARAGRVLSSPTDYKTTFEFACR
jgi:hypothetical protein